MNKRNKPASLTSSLLARKGEAEPAIEPYSFLEKGDGRAESAAGGDDAGSSGAGLATNGMTDGGTSGATVPAGMDNAVSANADSTSMHSGGGVPPESVEERESVRDRRLLRFVYATAVLTGVLAVVIYAGGWFFGEGTEPPQRRSRVIVMKSSPPSHEQPDRKSPAPEPATGSQGSAPPKPPAPPVMKPAANEAAVPRSPAKPAPTTRKAEPPKDSPASQPANANTKTKVVATESKIETRTKPVATPRPAKQVAIPKAPPAVPEKAVVAARATGTPAPTAKGRYYIQLASVPQESAAKKLWARLQKNFPDILGEYDLTVQKRVIADKGTFYRVQVGRFADFKDVRTLCDLLKRRNQPCLPVKR